jgi:hypothetical protein
MPTTVLQHVALLTLLSIHLIADYELYSNSSSSPIGTLVGMALPASQASLFALWACRARWPSFVRFPLAAVGVAAAWFVTIHFLPIARDSEMAAAHGMFFVVQAAAIVAVYAVSQLLLRRAAREKCADAPPPQFSIATLLIWTTVFALFLGLGKSLCLWMGWQTEVIRGRYFFFGCVIGVYNAFFALFALAAALAGRRLPLQLVFAVIAIGLVAMTEEWTLKLIFNNNGGVRWSDWLVMAASQAVFLFASLLPLRWCGLLEANDGRSVAGSPAIDPLIAITPDGSDRGGAGNEKIS